MHKIHIDEASNGDIRFQAYCEGCDFASRWVHADEFEGRQDPADLAFAEAEALGAEHVAEAREGVCSADSGSATDCQPICEERATQRVTYTLACYGTITRDLCDRHARSEPGRLYPTVPTITQL